MRPCGSCKRPTPGFLLINNDGLCNDCIAREDKRKQDKLTLIAYEYMEIDRRLEKFCRKKEASHEAANSSKS